MGLCRWRRALTTLGRWRAARQMRRWCLERSAGATRWIRPASRGRSRIFSPGAKSKTAKVAAGLAEGTYVGAHSSRRATAGGSSGKKPGAGRRLDRGDFVADAGGGRGGGEHDVRSRRLARFTSRPAISRRAPAEYGEDVRKRLELADGVRAADYLKGRETIRRAKAEFAAALERVDAIVAPTVPVVAPVIGSQSVRLGDAEEPMRSVLLRLTRPGNLTGLARGVGSVRIYFRGAAGWHAAYRAGV